MVSGHACVRVQKMAIPLLARGHNVYLVAKKIPSYYEHYKFVIHAPHIDHYLQALESVIPIADIFHVHNEPSWFVTAIKERTDKPVVLDVHDSFLTRITPKEADELQSQGRRAVRVMAEERNNFQLADGLVFPGEYFGNQIRHEFRLEQPYEIIPSAIPKTWFQYNCGEWMGGLVYEGRVDLKSQTNGPRTHGFRYCDYEDVALQAHEVGIDLHLYTVSSSPEFKAIYENISLLHEGRPMPKLLKSLTRHDWGLVGNLFKTPEWDVAFPNKLFDYMAACVPVVAINAPECGKFIKSHGIGIEVKNLFELAERWNEHRQCRNNLIKKRLSLSMENHMDALERLYERVRVLG